MPFRRARLSPVGNDPADARIASTTFARASAVDEPVCPPSRFDLVELEETLDRLTTAGESR
jgi:hypothetical protein